jgi:uncharacterized FAD-dependent dehydrogenase
MLRLNEIKLPLDHSDEELTRLVLTTLSIQAEKLLNVHVFKRSYDARKKSNILLIYQLDVELSATDEEQVLDAFEGNSSVRGIFRGHTLFTSNLCSLTIA